MEKLKRTPLYEEHLKLNAKIVPFGGWEMPLQYSSIIDEHLTVRNRIGLFDVSHMGEFFVSGDQAVDLLQKIVPQDISKLAVGKAVYCQLINEKAGIIDDLIIYRLENLNNKSNFLLIVNASRIEQDFKWISSVKDKYGYDADVCNESDKLAMIALQGPLASDLIQDMGLLKSDQPQKFFIKQAELDGFEILISRTGYTGEDGFEILVSNNKAPELWEKLLSKGEHYGIRPVGLGARDTLRLEAAMLLYGQDMNENITPVEASLGWSIPIDKHEDYFGKEIITAQMAGKDKKNVLIGFKMLDRSIPRHDYEIFKDGVKIGFITSGGVGPSVGANIGLGYIDAGISDSVGTKIEIDIRGKLHPAEIVKRPFYTRNRRR